MAHFKNIPEVNHEGKINYGRKIIDGIVFLAVSELEYVQLAVPSIDSKNTKDIIKVSINKGTVDVSVKIRILYSQSVSEIAFKVQEAVRHNIETMTEYKVNAVNVSVCGVTFSKDDQTEKKTQEKG